MKKKTTKAMKKTVYGIVNKTGNLMVDDFCQLHLYTNKDYAEDVAKILVGCKVITMSIPSQR